MVLLPGELLLCSEVEVEEVEEVEGHRQEGQTVCVCVFIVHLKHKHTSVILLTSQQQQLVFVISFINQMIMTDQWFYHQPTPNAEGGFCASFRFVSMVISHFICKYHDVEATEESSPSSHEQLQLKVLIIY